MPGASAHAEDEADTEDGEKRRIGAKRSDALVDLVLHPGGQESRVRYTARVVIPAGTALGVSDEPGELPGYGPIPGPLARALAADATWSRIITDPATGATLDIGADTYKPSARLAEFVRTRDRHCRFPGCRRPAARCDLDHTIAFNAGGRTIRINMAAVCRHHHRTNTWTGGPASKTPTAR